jgi:hypothetical protein
MAKYKLSTGLRTVTEEPEFETDAEAWEYLRTKIPDTYATLYRQTEVQVPHNNEEEYVPTWNAKYGPKPLGYGSDSTIPKKIGVSPTYKVWIPILEGITSHEYKINFRY